MRALADWMRMGKGDQNRGNEPQNFITAGSNRTKKVSAFVELNGIEPSAS
jgi:hypothetical protein